MKNWKIILWLILFFPVGLYLMFKHSNWSERVKYGISGLFALLTLATTLEGMPSFITIISFAIIVMGILLFDKNKNKKQSISIMLLGAILFGFSYQYTAAQEAEQARIEQQELEAEQARIEQREQEAKERLAERSRKQKITEKKEKEEKLKEQVITAIEKVNEEPTEANYLKAMTLINQLNNTDDQLVKKIEELKPVVEEYEKSLKVAKDAVEKAELDLNRESYNEADELVNILSPPNKSLANRLDNLDIKLAEIEEKEEKERLAKEEQEAARIAKEQEAEKIAKEQEAKVKATETVEAAQVINTEKVVYIAPDSGTKYHYSANCRGLSNANSVQEIDLGVAKSQGYGLCGWEK